jgi:hypothetical protein
MTTLPVFTLAQLLEVENDPRLLDFSCAATGVLLWPHIRTVFIRMAMSDLLYGTPLDGSVSKGVPVRRALATMVRSIARNAAFLVSSRAQADVCLLTSGIGNQIVDGRALNRLSDHFALAYGPQTITVEDHFHWQWPRARQNDRVMLHAPLQAWNAIGARLQCNDRHRRQAAQLVGVVADSAATLLDWRPGPAREAALVTMLAHKIAGMPQQMCAYDAMLKAVRPKVLMMIGACYGPSATLVRAARTRGVVTAEYQHGAIAPGHDGYNFGTVLRESAAYRASLPDHFLSYGSWWHGTVNAPVRKYAVGNPHRTFRLERLGTQRQRPKDSILILADGTEFGIYVDLARNIALEMRKLGFRVVIRPHPLERVSVTQQYGVCLDNLIYIDQSDDLYTSLLEAHAVVSELSTGLFEAVGIVDKLFMWDTTKARFAFPTLPFESFNCPEQLSALLSDDAVGRLPSEVRDGMWSRAWRSKYAGFLAACGVGVEQTDV